MHATTLIAKTMLIRVTGHAGIVNQTENIMQIMGGPRVGEACETYKTLFPCKRFACKKS